MHGLSPSYKTVSDFRSHNKKALRKTHKEFILFCNELSLFGGACIAVDGSFFKGRVSRKSFQTTRKLKQSLKQLNEHIEQWQEALEQRDTDEQGQASPLTDPELQEKLAQLEAWQQAKEEKTQALQALEEAGKTQHSRTEPDARLLNKGSQKVAGYNVQIVTDSQHHLIVADQVTTEPNDIQQLHEMSVQAKEVLGVETLDVLADGGYYSALQWVGCLNAGITAYVPKPSSKTKRKDKRYSKAQFKYQAEGDYYDCPAGYPLKKRGSARQQKGQWHQRYIASETHCKRCPIRSECISEKSSCREIWRSEYEEVLAAHRQRMQSNKDKMRKRSGAVEHPFGTIKSRLGWSHFLLRGKDKVSAEWSLIALSYNLTRVLNIMGIEAFIAAVINKFPFCGLNHLFEALLGGASDFCKDIDAKIDCYYNPCSAA